MSIRTFPIADANDKIGGLSERWFIAQLRTSVGFRGERPGGTGG